MLQPPGPSPASSTGADDRRAAQAEADMAEAGDVGEWLGVDSGSSRLKVIQDSLDKYNRNVVFEQALVLTDPMVSNQALFRRSRQRLSMLIDRSHAD